VVLHTKAIKRIHTIVFVMVDDGLREIFLNSRPAQVLIQIQNLENPYNRKLSDHIETTDAHIVNTVNRLQKHGLIEKEKDGRKNNLTLTDKGKNWTEKIKKFYPETEVRE